MPLPTHPVVLWFQTRLQGTQIVRGNGRALALNQIALALDTADLPPDLQTDAIFLHRANRLGAAFPAATILNSHDGFDSALTTGVNWPLAQRLHWQGVSVLELDRATGLIATAPQNDWEHLLAVLTAEFGSTEGTLPPVTFTPRLALVNAMRPELLEEAAAQGVGVYLTGQLRPGALDRARQLGLGVVALGHRRTELWGLRQLARELETAFPDLRVTVYGEA